jgi:hypothetical protein
MNAVISILLTSFPQLDQIFWLHPKSGVNVTSDFQNSCVGKSRILPIATSFQDEIEIGLRYIGSNSSGDMD